jgi:hypothetical protein
MTLTPQKGYTLPIVGADFNAWGSELNGNFSIIDRNIGSTIGINCAGNSNVTVTTSQAQNMYLILYGALTGNITLILPAMGAFYIIYNGTTGGFSITVQTTAAVGSFIIPQGTAQSDAVFAVCDGTNIFALSKGAAGGTWNNNTPYRAFGNLYTNSTGRLVTLSILARNLYGSNSEMQGYVNGALIGITNLPAGGGAGTFYMAVPVGATYQVNMIGNPVPLTSWYELY